MRVLALMTSALMVAMTPPLAAQQAPGLQLAQKAASGDVATAKLRYVDGDGVFELRQGRSIDLTRNEILLNFAASQKARNFENATIVVKIVGQTTTMTVGDRRDLKAWHATRSQTARKDKCYLDLIDLVAPQGAPATATFRFTCI